MMGLPATSAGSCADLRSPDFANFGVSIFILVGILISYLPQHWRIVARHSSEGLSPYYVLLGTTSGTCAFTNVLTAPPSQHALGCCRKISGLECFSGVLGIAQIGVQWACFTIMYAVILPCLHRLAPILADGFGISLFLYLLYFPHATPLTSPSKAHGGPTYCTAVTVFGVCMLHFAICFVISLIVIYVYPKSLRPWADFIGVLGALLAVTQFLPQIWTTWRLQKVGSLSIYSMCIQTPGSFVWVGSLAARLGAEGWSTWGIYLVTGILQGTLLIMSIGFEVRDWRQRKKERQNGTADPNDDEANVDETSRLVGNE